VVTRSISHLGVPIVDPTIIFSIALSIATCFAPSPASGQFPRDVYLAQTPADNTVFGESNYHKTGFGLTAGDFDADGFRDLAVLTPGSAAYGSASVQIFWGRYPREALIDLATYEGDMSVVTAPDGESGIPCSITAGDFNGDGVDDLALGIVWDQNEITMDGKVYVILGGPEWPALVDLTNPPSSVTSIHATPGSGGWLGTSMTSGDINADGFDDLVVSAPAYPPAGQVYVIYGRATFPPSIELAAPRGKTTELIDPYLWQMTGAGLACSDINGDGFDDLVIGSPGEAEGFYEGTVRVILGARSLPRTIYLYRNSPGVKQFFGEYEHGQLGWQVAVGDIDGNGVAELVLAAEMADPLGCQDCGELYVLSWDENLPDSINVGDATLPIIRLLGTGRDDHYGRGLRCADVSGDGYDDILVSSDPDLLIPSDVGKVTLVYGSSSLPDTLYLKTDSFVTRFHGEDRYDDFGRGLAIGDVNDDGLADILVGASYASPLGRTDAGKAYVVLGVQVPTGIHPVLSPRLSLFQNYPNPFSGSTAIAYEIETGSVVRLTVYDIQGRAVAQICLPPQPAGLNRVTWDGLDGKGRKVASGVYFYRLQAGGVSQTKKLNVLR